jgi:hypothetical protein
MDALLSAISPDWFGRILAEFQNAVNRNEPFTPPVSVSVYLIFQGVLCSLIAGFATAAAAKENRKSTARARHFIAGDGRFRRSVSLELFPALVSRFVFAAFNSGDHSGRKIE